MKNLIWKYSMLLLLSWFCNQAQAQNAVELETAQLFDTPITWIKEFNGSIDGIHKASLSIGYDGVHCKGYMTYTSSGDRFLLDGTLQNGELILLEKYENLPSGFIHGSMDEDQLNLNWRSVDDKLSYHSSFKANINEERINLSKLNIYAGVLDDQSVKVSLQKRGRFGEGSLIFGEQHIEKIYADYSESGKIKIKNLTSGHIFDLINTRDQQFEANFLLPGSNIASQLGLRQISSLDIIVEEYLSHDVDHEIILPNLDSVFVQKITSMIQPWKQEMFEKRKAQAATRFGNAAKIWFEIESYSPDYISGVLFYNSTWNKKIESMTFSYHLKNSEMISLAPFLKGSSKWEKAVKERMLAAKELNSVVEKDQYKKWIEGAELMEPILCEEGLQFLTKSNAVFGQASTFMPWESLSPLVISSSKLSKLRKTK